MNDVFAFQKSGPVIRSATARKLVAEFAGTMILLATVIGSGIMAERLAGGNVAVALLGNTIPTGAILYVLITVSDRYPGRISIRR